MVTTAIHIPWANSAWGGVTPPKVVAVARAALAGTVSAVATVNNSSIITQITVGSLVVTISNLPSGSLSSGVKLAGAATAVSATPTVTLTTALLTTTNIAPTVAAILTAMADNTLDVAYITNGTISGTIGIVPNITRTKPIIIKPLNAGMVTADGGLTNSPFAYWGYNGNKQNTIALQGLSYINFQPIQTGVHWLGDCDKIDLSDSTITFKGGDNVIAGNHFLYLSSYNLKGPTNAVADRCTVDATDRTANALHAYHDPGFSNFHGYNWVVKNCNKGLLIWSGSGLDVSGWTISYCNQPADITQTGTAKNMTATNCTTAASVAAGCVQTNNSW